MSEPDEFYCPVCNEFMDFRRADGTVTHRASMMEDGPKRVCRECWTAYRDTGHWPDDTQERGRMDFGDLG